MPPDPKMFTLEEACALVPKLRELVGRQLTWRAEIEDHLRSLAAATGEVPAEVAPPQDDDPPPVRALKRELVTKIGAYQEGWGEVEKLGAVVKDPRIGLVDFYGHVEGKTVWLCWKYGEEEIAHYHGLDEGFANRKPIGVTLKRRLLN
jgi:hypothetical protein